MNKTKRRARIAAMIMSLVPLAMAAYLHFH